MFVIGFGLRESFTGEFTTAAGFFELFVAIGVDLLMAPFEPVLGGDEPDGRVQAGRVAERTLLSGIGDGEGGVGHVEVGGVGVWGEGGVRIWANEVWAGDFGSFRVIGGEKGRLADRVF